MKTWESKTKHFDDSLMKLLQGLPVGELEPMITGSDPLMALRLLAELLLNGKDGETKLARLVGKRTIRKRWLTFASEPKADARDHEYAAQVQGFTNTVLGR